MMSGVKKTLDRALNQPMDRRKFLAQAGAITVGLIGVSAVLRALEQKDKNGGSNGGGYGASGYGR